MIEERERSVGFGYVTVMRIFGALGAASILFYGVAIGATIDSSAAYTGLASVLPMNATILGGVGAAILGAGWYFSIEVLIKFFENMATTAYNAQVQTRLLKAMMENQGMMSKQIAEETRIIGAK